MNYLRLTLLTASISVLSSNIFAQSMDLLQVYQEAVERDPQIAAAKFQAQAGNELEVQGKSTLLPQFNIGAEVGYNYDETDFDNNAISDSSKKYDSWGLSANFVQPIYRSANWKGFQQSKLGSEQANIELSIAEQELILRVAQAYFDVLAAEENVGVSKAQTRAFSESLERAKLTFKVGTATKTDMLEAQARYDIAVAAEIAAKNQLAIAKQALGSIIGTVPSSLKKPEQNVKLIELQPTDMQHWVDTAQNNNLTLKLSNLGFDVSNIEVKKLKSDRLPTVDFVASARQGKSFNSFSGDFISTSMGVSVQLAMPIYTGGLLSSRIREAESKRLQQKQLKINSERQVQLQTQQAYLNALNGKQQVDALRQALISNSSALEATKKGVEVGVRTNLDLLDAQQQFFATERDFSVAKFNYLITILQLKAAAGTLAEEDVKELNQLLTRS